MSSVFGVRVRVLLDCGKIVSGKIVVIDGGAVYRFFCVLFMASVFDIYILVCYFGGIS